jgi:VanZ family protein
MNRRPFRWIPSILWGVLIAVLSLIPGGPGNLNFLGIPYFDKIGHFGMYAVWTFLFVLALSADSPGTNRKSMWIAIGIGTLTGVTLEFVQNFMNLGRIFEIMDMAANMLGAVLGALVGSQFYRFRNKIVKKYG